MKKKYITPESNVYSVETISVIATSINDEYDPDDVSYKDSRRDSWDD